MSGGWSSECSGWSSECGGGRVSVAVGRAAEIIVTLRSTTRQLDDATFKTK